ncbi:2Fe-2S iron-sulfur cluster-binding protein [Crocosphaera sp.]|uniref:2Fe-2S iron-sulfur cluster-binding protein n=1 Tax=Crocosphaera sp. TaxID=2729996 RepID=UPI002634FBB6|nr:2Fe-2S iron-sulfur cluster-binding protein [Crocosphaera sp.]MDJ0579357.1 FAD-binding oxidoreductase [Crocosphaera sp.]
MLKIKLFNPQHPLEHQELELSDHRLKDEGCLIGNSPSCGLMLPSVKVQEIHGKLFTDKGKYYFQDLTEKNLTQYNDETVKKNKTYPLETDDIIRIGEFVLIVDGLPIKKKMKSRKSKNRKNNKSSNKRSLQNIKALTRKKRHSTEKKTERLEPSNPIIIDPKTTLNNYQLESASSSVNGANGTIISPPSPRAKKENKTSPNPQKNTQTIGEYKPPKLEGINWWNKGKITVRCLNIIEDTQDVKTFRFIGTSPTLFNYKPGQFVTLNLNINDKIVKRSYSISSTPSRPHTLEITVKRVPPPADVPEAPPGLVSNWLHDNLQVGDEITLTGPSGKFTCVDHNATKLLFISAGSGITPMMSMSRWALDTVAERDITFVHSARSPRDIIYRKELEAMAANHTNFHLGLTITRQTKGDPWWGFQGRLNEVLLPAICPDYKERVIYVCGPDGFMKGVKNLVEGLGFPMENYYQESFGSSKKKRSPSSQKKNDNSSFVAPQNNITNNSHNTTPKPAQVSSNNTSYPVVFAQSGKEVLCNEEMSLLDLAEEEMIEVDSSCRSGGCGSCKVKKLEGNIRYEGEPDGLDQSDAEDGYILACIAHPEGKVVIDA